MSKYPNNKNEYTVRNKGRKVGISRVYKKNLRRIGLIGVSYVVATTVGFFVGRLTKDDDYFVDPYPKNVVSEEMLDIEPTYNEIEYTVKDGDSLTGIVYQYENDPDKVYNYIEEICDLSGIKNASSIKKGMEIKLVGVPESCLENYGYSADYSLFEPIIELDDRLNFLKKTVDKVSSRNINEAELSVYLYRLSQLEEDHQEYLMTKDEDLLDDLLNEARSLCYELNDLTGLDFGNNKNAYPLSIAINYEPSVMNY